MPLLRLDDPRAKAGQIEGGKGNAQQEAFEGIRGGEMTRLKLEATRLLIAEALFNVESQAVLVEGAGIGRLRTREQPGIVGAVGQTG